MISSEEGVSRQSPVLHHPQPKQLPAAFLDISPPNSSGSIHAWLNSLEWPPLWDRRYSRSAPTIVHRSEDSLFEMPTPTSKLISQPSLQPRSLSRTTKGRLIEDPNYRVLNLAANDISLLRSYQPVPGNISDLINLARKDRKSPEPTEEEIRQDGALEVLGRGASEPEVEKFFTARIFPDCSPSDVLKQSSRHPMTRDTVPQTNSTRISTPIPDLLYGYNREVAFPQQGKQLISLGTDPMANGLQLLYPFLLVEFKAEGPLGAANLWAATNQCLGGSASCVNIAQRLQLSLIALKKETPLISSASFSIAMSNIEARLYISWKQDELNYYMTQIDSFLLQRPRDYIDFRKHVRNILEWGKGERLTAIKNSVGELFVEGKKRSIHLTGQELSSSDSSANKKLKSS